MSEFLLYVLFLFISWYLGVLFERRRISILIADTGTNHISKMRILMHTRFWGAITAEKYLDKYYKRKLL